MHSLVRLLSLYEGIQLIYISPPSLALPSEIVEEVKALGVPQQTKTLEEVLPIVDVLYVTRIQKERFSSEEEYNAVSGTYKITAETMKKAKSKMIIMHPLPRLQEIATDVDSDPRAAYFRQTENGMYIRMALLDYLLGDK